MAEAVAQSKQAAAAETPVAKFVHLHNHSHYSLLEQLAVDAGLPVEALQIGDGDELHQVVITGSGFGQQYQVVGIEILAAGFVEVTARRDIGLNSDYWLDGALFGFIVKLNGAR